MFQMAINTSLNIHMPSIPHHSQLYFPAPIYTVGSYIYSPIMTNNSIKRKGKRFNQSI